MNLIFTLNIIGGINLEGSRYPYTCMQQVMELNKCRQVPKPTYTAAGTDCNQHTLSTGSVEGKGCWIPRSHFLKLHPKGHFRRISSWVQLWH